MKIYTVSEISLLIKQYVEDNNEFRFVCVKGEISNINVHNKNTYLTLKDGRAVIPCVALYFRNAIVPQGLKNGDKVTVYGNITLYPEQTRIQLNVEKIEKENSLGELYQKYEELKKEYQEKGYFDDSRKKPLPNFPRKIGVVTSETGDAIKDIIKNTHIRDERVEIYLYPAKVQGVDSAKSIVKGIEFFNNTSSPIVDLIIIGRGGGNIEDLWAFNERDLIEAIIKSNLPIISAVGHEADVLLSDFVSDKRASTPTQAPILCIKDKEQLDMFFQSKINELNKILLNNVEKEKTKLEYLKDNYYITNFHNNNIVKRKDILNNKKVELNNLVISKAAVLEKTEKLNGLKKEINHLMKMKFEANKGLLNELKAKLEKYNVDDIFDRGFTLTTFDGENLKNAKLKKGVVIKTTYKDGELKTIESEIKKV